jgi:large subunit ribosomal protein L17
MRKNVFGKQLSRDKNERAGLFKGLMSSLVLNESIKTTEAKAKAIKSEVEKLVTKAKKEERSARALLGKRLNPEAIEKMITGIAPRFKDRKGGYTRIVRLSKRFGDDAQVVLMEWVEKPVIEVVSVDKKQIKDEPKKEEKKVSSKTKTVKKETKKTVAKKPRSKK